MTEVAKNIINKFTMKMALLWIMKKSAPSKFGLLAYTSFPAETRNWCYQSVTITMQVKHST